MKYGDTEYQEWYDSRPQIIKDLIDKVPPGKYLLEDGCNLDYYTPRSYSENGTLALIRWCGQSGLRKMPGLMPGLPTKFFNKDEAMWIVFGIKPEELTRVFDS